MKISAIFAAATALAVTACGKPEQNPQNAPEANQSQAPRQEAVYSGTGTVTAVAGDQVTIDHGPIPAIGWPAMTMTFTAPDDVAAGVEPGTDVGFSFREDAGQHVLTALQKR